MMQEFVDQINKSARSATGGYAHGSAGRDKKLRPGQGVATVLPKAKFTKPDGSTMDFPEISGVPVMFPQSKNVTIAWPIKKGDGCLLVFSEQALDYWMYGKETDTKLKFDLTNAIAIPNLTSGGNSTMKLACDEDAVHCRRRHKSQDHAQDRRTDSRFGQGQSGAEPCADHSRRHGAGNFTRRRGHHRKAHGQGVASPQGMMSRHPTAVSALQTTSTGATAAA